MLYKDRDIQDLIWTLGEGTPHQFRAHLCFSLDDPEKGKKLVIEENFVGNNFS